MLPFTVGIRDSVVQLVSVSGGGVIAPDDEVRQAGVQRQAAQLPPSRRGQPLVAHGAQPGQHAAAVLQLLLGRRVHPPQALHLLRPHAPAPRGREWWGEGETGRWSEPQAVVSV